MLAGARSKTTPRSPHSHLPQVREHMVGEQTTKKYRSVDDLDIEGLSKLKPADRQAIKNKAVETLNEIRRAIPSEEGTREPESPDPWDNLGHLQPPLNSTAICRVTPTITKRRHFMHDGERLISRRITEEVDDFQTSDEDSNDDGKTRDEQTRPKENTWTQRTTRVAHDGDFSSDATSPSWGEGGGERSPTGGRVNPTLPSRGGTQPLELATNAVDWAVEAQKKRQRKREEDERDFEILLRRSELLERDRRLQRKLEELRNDVNHPGNPRIKRTNGIMWPQAETQQREYVTNKNN